MINDGGPAFARTNAGITNDGRSGCESQKGMTLRDYFAAAALTGAVPTIFDLVEGAEASGKEEQYALRLFAKGLYELADAMLAERDKPVNTE